MKLLLNQHFSYKLVSSLSLDFPGTEHVMPLKLDQASDEIIWSFSKKNGYTIVSKDVDFYNRSALFGHPPKVIWLRIGNSPSSKVLEVIKTHSRSILNFMNDPDDKRVSESPLLQDFQIQRCLGLENASQKR